MKRFVYGLVIVFLFACATSCRKTSFIESADAYVTFSSDTLHFDTVFTTTGSITQSFKIFNLNDQKLKLSNVKLMGGNASSFKLNVDGTPGVNFNDIEIAPNDSIYVFATVTINPNAANLAFIVRDSILINFNGNNRFVQLDAYGQNANFYWNRRIKSNEVWSNNLPFVILGGLTVDSNVTLTIQKGCKIFCHADAPIVVNGTLKVTGEKYDSTRVVFRGDRLDEGYRDFPGGWPGILFNPSSKDNVLNYAVIKNAYQGIVTQLPSVNNNPKVSLNQCIIDNVYDAGILGLASDIKAVNCLISNCGKNIALGAGGNYSFNHCTVASYGNLYLSHKDPVLLITNVVDQNQTFDLKAAFSNCIFWGEGGIVDNEIAIEKKGTTPFNITFENVIYKVKDVPTAATFNNSFKNTPPEFDSIDAGRRYFDFHLKPTSPAIDKATFNLLSPVTIDLDGKLRGSKPDIGCYEK
jgi:hypothetical protein